MNYAEARPRTKSGTFLSGPLRSIDKEYIENRIEIDGNGCWIWQKAKQKDGYGVALYKNGNSVLHIRMHRKSYELYKGEIPDKLVIDHLCEVRACINPEHLEAVTVLENIERSKKFNGNLTHCKRGHEFTPENTYTRPNGHRNCITCKNIKEK